MKKHEFRIEEYNGEFRVQRFFEYDPYDYRRRKKPVNEWINISDRGMKPYYFHAIPVIESMRPFKSLKDARRMIDIIIEGKKYHKAN